MKVRPLTRPATRAVHAGAGVIDPAAFALEAPIVLSSAYAFESADDAAAQFRGERDGYIYSRWRNPTVEAFEKQYAMVEGAEDAVALASGMSAVHAAVAAQVRAGDRIVAPKSIYGETARLFREVLPRFGVETTFVDQTDLAAVEAAAARGMRVLYAETPGNPTLAVSDLAALSRIAGTHGAVSIVDGTFATPWHQHPLALGIDLVVHSATKAIGGHGDAIGGVVGGARERVREVRELGVRACGGAMSPLTAMLVSRGMRTLGLRMERSSASALELARRLEADPRIERLWYPGLRSHPQHEVAVRQMEAGFGAMIALEPRGGLERGRRCYDAVELFVRAVSLGDVRSLITQPATTTHASMPREDRIAGGIGDALLRLSVGIEDVDDLWEDLDRALG